jgi:hypothetical protein
MMMCKGNERVQQDARSSYSLSTWRSKLKECVNARY